MRNLKRALSLALASVMLLGMMVVGSSAAFADADEIVNTEAVEITAGLGLFAGSDGKFNPKGNVTRAQMATVIVKMLYGSEINADQYKGINKFNDVAAFEGGWAEGYINLCASLEIVGGYGDGTFKPGQAVTTAEAVTMIINALDIDAGEGTWPMTVMAKAEEIELFEDMKGVKPGTNMAMVRDQLAVIVWNGLNYSAEGIKGYSVTGSKIVFESWADAAAYADKAIRDDVYVGDDTNGDPIYENRPVWGTADIQPIKNDTLAKTVFELAPVSAGYVVANQATGEKCTILSNGVKLDLETGLDMLGHYVKAYYAVEGEYKNEKNPGTAYTLVEAAEYIVLDEDIEAKDRKTFVATFGSKPEIKSMWMLDKDGYNAADVEFIAPSVTFNSDYATTAGTYVVDIEDGKIIAYLAPNDIAIGKITRVNTTPGKESIKIGTNAAIDNTAENDMVVEYAGIAKDDVVVIKDFRGVTYLEKAEVISGSITKTGKIDDKAVTYINGTAYYNTDTADTTYVPVIGIADMKKTDAASKIKTYDAYVYGDKLLGLLQTSGAAALTDAIFVINKYTVDVASAYGTTEHYYAQGINGNGEEVSFLVGIKGVSDTDGQDKSYYDGLVLNSFYTFKNEREDAKKAAKDIMKPEVAPIESAFATDIANDTNALEFFGAEATVANSKLEKDTKTIAVSGKDVYLTADTKFVVVEKVASTGTGSELEIATYTGTISKTLESGDKAFVAANADQDDNYLAQIVVIVASKMNLAAEDYIYVIDKDACDGVDGGLEYNVYFSATNEFKDIVVKGSTKVNAGFYGSYEVDEEGFYILGTPTTSASFVETEEEVKGIVNTSIKFGTDNLYEAKDAVVVDIRTKDMLKNTHVEFETIEDIFALKRDGYQIMFNALVDTEDEDAKAITHIFVYDINVKDDSDNWVDA